MSADSYITFTYTIQAHQGGPSKIYLLEPQRAGGATLFIQFERDLPPDRKWRTVGRKTLLKEFKHEVIPVEARLYSDVVALTSTFYLPPVAEATLGFDGTTFTLEIANGWSSCTFSWWVHLPPEWEALLPLIEKILVLNPMHEAGSESPILSLEDE